MIMAIDFKKQLEQFRQRQRQAKPSRVPQRPVAKVNPPRWNDKADKVLWKWMLGYDRMIKVCPVRRIEQDEVLMHDWMFQRGDDGTYVRATKVMTVIHRRAMDRSKAGFKSLPAIDAINELCAAIRASGGWDV